MKLKTNVVAAPISPEKKETPEKKEVKSVQVETIESRHIEEKKAPEVVPVKGKDEGFQSPKGKIE